MQQSTIAAAADASTPRAPPDVTAVAVGDGGLLTKVHRTAPNLHSVTVATRIAPIPVKFLYRAARIIARAAAHQLTDVEPPARQNMRQQILFLLINQTEVRT